MIFAHQRARQPAFRTPLNRASPLVSSALVSAFVPAVLWPGFDFVTSVGGIASGFGTYRALARDAYGAYFTKPGLSSCRSSLRATIGTDEDFTVGAVFSLSGALNGDYPIGTNSDASTFVSAVGLGTDGTLYVYLNSATAETWAATSAGFLQDGLHTIVYKRNTGAGNRLRVYFDGTQIIDATPNDQYNRAVTTLVSTGLAGSTAYPPSTGIRTYGIYVWRGTSLPDSAIRSFHYDPWQGFGIATVAHAQLTVLAPSYPTLSAAELINLSQTQATPRVTITVP